MRRLLLPLLVIAMVFVAGSAAVTASADETPPPQLAPLVDFEAYISSFPDMSDQLVDNLAQANDALAAVPDTVLGGLWIDPSDSSLKIGVVGLGGLSDVVQSLLDTIQGLLASTLSMDVALVSVQNSQATLDGIVNDVYDQPGLSAISSAMHDYTNNRVILTSSVPVTSDIRTAAYAAYGSAVVIGQDPRQPELATRSADRTPFYAGAGIGLWGGATVCTMGFSWIATANLRRVLSAGHCGLAPGSNSTVGADWGTLQTTGAGTFSTYDVGRTIVTTWNSHGTVGAYGDISMIDTTRSSSGAVMNRRGAPYMWISADQATPILSVTKTAKTGQRICWSAAFSGNQCGNEIQDGGYGGANVKDTSMSVKYTDGTVAQNLVYASKGWGRCPRHGDSGGPVYVNTPGTGVSAAGIISGTGGGGSDNYVGHYENDHCEIYYTAIGRAYSKFPGGHIEVYTP